ncbi:redox-sensing transcriptional repressor Rex [Tepidibacter formicigenes]|jgi:redox-sensing transcriptional repressor|uniref:Redox-sensing transcriptional repressor Rex n=1 Tax=Tepidibacter formicigenes DSM 15518 TaxID=1123349 RepID=A0A1M6TB53_9FIRM|nr:redox-sensing transcriptional repressor Rex [Tepidibacter formicigenes]SHK54282.1 redox-sensing transcriptional repressor [Tepidibacter formicigenes DSM 15518]
MAKQISMAVIRRLPKYHRYLKDLLEREIYRISSKELSEIIGFTASQIRQDLNNFGGFGQQGYGYNVEELYSEISKILGLHNTYNTIIVGAGNLGQAIANYSGFQKSGFEIKALFEANPRFIGLKIRDLEILDVEVMEEYIKENNIKIAVICTPKESAQDIANKLVKAGISGIWNFAPVDLQLDGNVVVENVHLTESLFTLSYLLNEKEEATR